MKNIKDTISKVNENIDDDIEKIIKRIDVMIKNNNINYDDFVHVFIDTFCNQYKSNGARTLNHVLDKMF